MSREHDDTRIRPRNAKRHARRADVLTVLAPTRGTEVILPTGYPLRQAKFKRLGRHLFAHAPGHPGVVVRDFFAGGGQTTLVTEDGVELSRHMVLLMANLSTRLEKALGELSIPGRGRI